MKATSNPTISTYERINALLEKEIRNILQQESQNENRIHLYDVGEYWVAFEKSAYLLEQLIPKGEHPVVLYMKNHPFPIVMLSTHYLRVKELCRHHALAKRRIDRLQLFTQPIEKRSYQKWYNKLCDKSACTLSYL